MGFPRKSRVSLRIDHVVAPSRCYQDLLETDYPVQAVQVLYWRTNEQKWFTLIRQTVAVGHFGVLEKL